MLRSLEFKEITSEESFNPLDLNPETPFTQGYFYGEWQKSLGRTVKRFEIKSGTDILCLLQLVKYPLLRGKSYLYAPYGPGNVSVWVNAGSGHHGNNGHNGHGRR